MGNYQIKDDQTSEFDSNYLGNGHGGVPVNQFYNCNQKVDNIEKYENYIIRLKEGENDVKLLYCSSICDIRNIKVIDENNDNCLVKLKLKKYSGMDRIKNTYEIETDDLMSHRTLFVAYRDCLTKLSITAPKSCKIHINY